MPSDTRIDLALDAVSGQIADYRAAVLGAAERVRGMLAAGESGDRARLELGALGATRIDSVRFADLSRGAVLESSVRGVVEHASDVLRRLADLPRAAFSIHVPEGDHAASRIGSALSDFGRAFGAAYDADLVRAGRFDASGRSEVTVGHGFERWTSSERSVAPPIVAIVNGADMHAGELCELLDGSLHIILVVKGVCPPAALARLITPGTFVVQTTDARGLDRFSDFPGPAVAALVDDDAACFVHDPSRGTAPWQRIDVWKQPKGPQLKRIGGESKRQQREELGQLAALAMQPGLTKSDLGELIPSGANAVDRLTDWLLAESGLSGRNDG